MSEVFKKKKKKRRHSSFTDFETPNKRIKLELNDTADSSIVLSSPPVGLNCDASGVQRQRKHKHRHTFGEDVNTVSHASEGLNQTGTDDQYNTSSVSVECQAYMPGLEKSSSHKRTGDVNQQDSLRHQSVLNNSQSTDRLFRSELR